MWFWVISAIAGSILGNAADSWFSQTKLGMWFYKKVDDVSTWASKKLGLKVLRDEEDWKKKYPNVALQIESLEARIKKLEKENYMSEWIADRIKEGSSHQGAIIAAGAALVLFAGMPLMKVGLYAALVWGVWSMLKKG